MTKQGDQRIVKKLKSRKLIEELFAHGKSFSVLHLRVTYRLKIQRDDINVEVGVTTGKKYFRRAVERNRIKRLLREALRLQLMELTSVLKEKERGVILFFNYTGKTVPDFITVCKAISVCLKKLDQKIKDDENNG